MMPLGFPRKFFFGFSLVIFWTAFLGATHDLVDIQAFNPHVLVDMRYATQHNPLGKAIYPSHKIYIDGYVATRLGRVQRELAREGLGLIIYEGYRPPSVQAILDAHREKHSHHCYQFDDSGHYRKALGVDVSIYYSDCQLLELPTPWGEDGARAYQDYPYLPAHVYHNRMILEKYMKRHGFVPMRERWWHFDLKGWEMAPDLNLEYNGI